jgi:VIT1/CCC1 family predicted Fe2+/Mn2+ transporter
VAQRVLDPLERSSEVLFGLIMVLTFTTSISVAESGREETRSVLVGALSCNLAWGIVDAAMYLMANLMTRARSLASYQALRRAGEQEEAHELIRAALPPQVAAALTPASIESLREKLLAQELPSTTRLSRTDIAGALGVFLLVFLSTFPVVIPFILISDARIAMRTSNAVAVLMMFGTGWSLGRYAGTSGWRTGLATIAIGLVLMAITVALGG